VSAAPRRHTCRRRVVGSRSRVAAWRTRYEPWRSIHALPLLHYDMSPSDNDVRLAQKLHFGPCIPVGIQVQKAEVGPTSGPTWRLSHSVKYGAWLCFVRMRRHARQDAAIQYHAHTL
jgi:hypothetical protein